MLPLFTLSKAFRSHIDVIQTSAIQSWMRLAPGIEIILFGTDKGAAEVAREFGLRRELDVERDEFGTFRVCSAFAKAQSLASYNIVCYVNCDVILLHVFCQVKPARPGFLMVGQRTGVDARNPWPVEYHIGRDDDVPDAPVHKVWHRKCAKKLVWTGVQGRPSNRFSSMNRAMKHRDRLAEVAQHEAPEYRHYATAAGSI